MDARSLLEDPAPARDPGAYLELARDLAAKGDLRGAASAADRGYGLDPAFRDLAELRKGLLEGLCVRERGMVFRYVPAGWFRMGSDEGDPDERPAHPVRTGDYWLSEAPVSWALYCEVLDWPLPPVGTPRDPQVKGLSQEAGFNLHQARKIRLQYCEDATLRARDWHAHDPLIRFAKGDKEFEPEELFGKVPREGRGRPPSYSDKPLVAVSWQDAEEFCRRLSPACRLPTEAEWEKAARGGLAGARYPWGNDPPTRGSCDFNRFDEFSIRPSRTFPPNGYGLYAMSGSVWEWTSDRYDAEAYRADRPPAPEEAGGERAIRGGSWADCAEAVTVSFRMSLRGMPWRAGVFCRHLVPNVRFRVCRVRA